MLEIPLLRSSLKNVSEYLDISSLRALIENCRHERYFLIKRNSRQCLVKLIFLFWHLWVDYYCHVLLLFKWFDIRRYCVSQFKFYCSDFTRNNEEAVPSTSPNRPRPSFSVRTCLQYWGENSRVPGLSPPQLCLLVYIC